MPERSQRAAAPPSRDSVIPGDVVAGKYVVEGVVGRGGMGLVVAARYQTLGQRVAIKVLQLDGAPGEQSAVSATRFLREAQAAARLTSDHVVRVHDVGQLTGGSPFMVMELLAGEDLASLVERLGPAPLDVAVDFVLQAADALGEAHAQGIVHRDVKPANLFVTRRSDGRALVKVLDFGISKATAGSEFDGGLTDTRAVVGSPYYMSPEQVRDAKRVDARSDIWSLGMVLYELLAGEPAFHADMLPAICAAIVADEPPPIGQYRLDLPGGLADVVMRCLAKEPAQRFPDVASLVAALARYRAAELGPAAAAWLPDVALRGSGAPRSS
ncbi:MAG: serine/threonine protein kinase, partial [Deltaproteobacteria bacterium]|nr:serine/threonine protein kinase [Deltaproteobacteria bacterium]